MPNAYNQLITVWVATGSDGYGGNTFKVPRLISGRWEDRQEEYINPKGETSVSRAVVTVSKKTGDCITLGDYISFGESLEAIPSNAESFVVRQKLRVSDVRNVKSEVRLIL